MGRKILVIRFSSFGDIIQCMGCLIIMRDQKTPEIHWLARQEYAAMLSLNLGIDRVMALDRRTGLKGLISLALQLRQERYTHIYDAHSSLRSHILSLILRCRFSRPQFLRRSKERWKRFLLFSWGINRFPDPYRGMISYISPIKSWYSAAAGQVKKVEFNFPADLTAKWRGHNNLVGNSVVFVPSAAWPMKRWPLSHWKRLIEIMSTSRIVILGGPEDTFCAELEEIDSSRVTNMAGKLTLIESCFFVAKSKLIISADTGLLHVADLLGVSGIALLGPSAFGGTSGESIKILEVKELTCRPCSKDGSGSCANKVYQKCMLDINPEQVAELALNIFQ